jgi:hypothetical protein
MRPPPASLLKVGDLPARLHAVQGDVRDPATLGRLSRPPAWPGYSTGPLLGFLHRDGIGVGIGAIAGALLFALILSVGAFIGMIGRERSALLMCDADTASNVIRPSLVRIASSLHADVIFEKDISVMEEAGDCRPLASSRLQLILALDWNRKPISLQHLYIAKRMLASRETVKLSLEP